MNGNNIDVYLGYGSDEKWQIKGCKRIPGKYTDPVGNLLKDDAKKIFNLLDKKLPIGTWDELKLLFKEEEL